MAISFKVIRLPNHINIPQGNRTQVVHPIRLRHRLRRPILAAVEHGLNPNPISMAIVFKLVKSSIPVETWLKFFLNHCFSLKKATCLPSVTKSSTSYSTISNPSSISSSNQPSNQLNSLSRQSKPKIIP